MDDVDSVAATTSVPGVVGALVVRGKNTMVDAFELTPSAFSDKNTPPSSKATATPQGEPLVLENIITVEGEPPAGAYVSFEAVDDAASTPAPNASMSLADATPGLPLA